MKIIAQMFKICLPAGLSTARLQNDLHLISFAITFSLLAAIISLLAFGRESQNSKEPPLLRHWLPYFGHGNALGRDFRGFFTWANKKAQGDPFTMIAGGEKFHIFHRPEDVSAIYKKSATLTEIRNGHDMFRLNILGFEKADAKVIAGLRKEDVRIDGEYLLGKKELDVMNARFVEEVDAHLLDLEAEITRATESRIRKDALEWIGELMLDSTLATLFGDKAFGEYVNVFSDLKMFIREKFFLRNLGLLPDCFAKNAIQARERMKKKLRKVVRGMEKETREDHVMENGPCGYIKERIKVMGALGLGEEGLVANELDLILGANMNSIPMAHITLLHLLDNPSLLECIRAELSGVDWDNLPTEARATVLPDGLPRLHALFREVMRYHATTWSLREVQAPTTLELKIPSTLLSKFSSQPRVYELQKGSIVGMPSSLLHYNPEIHENPEVFEAKRFLAKGLGGWGTPVTARTLRPFGGGLSYCPGRKFAERQVLGLIASVVAKFDFEIRSKSWEIPRNADFIFVIACKEVEVEVSRRVAYH